MSTLGPVSSLPYMSVSQASTQAVVPKRTLQHAIAKGDLPAHKLPGRTGAYLITPADLHAWLAGRGRAA